MADSAVSNEGLSPLFLGRQKELIWLHQAISEQADIRHTPAPIVILGAGGIGKTALVRHFLKLQEDSLRVAWFDARHSSRDGRGQLDTTLRAFSAGRSGTDVVVVLDGVSEVNEAEQRDAIGHILNYKVVRVLIVTSRTDPAIPGARVLQLAGLQDADAKDLLQSDFSGFQLEPAALANVLRAVNGHPLAISMVGSLAKTIPTDQLLRVLDGKLYDLDDSPIVTKNLVTVVQPTIISANRAMVEALKKRPEDVFHISARKYEELVAELLDDMGYDVQLTQATRDGGKDILAYFRTACGTFLCLVEAKRYRSDRTIGMALVRTLYGTLCDYQANSAMLVTTSSFSPDAREFQKKHAYQLALRDYTDLTAWIQNYGTSGKSYRT